MACVKKPAAVSLSILASLLLLATPGAAQETPPSCNGLEATIFVTDPPEDDWIYGTEADDVIVVDLPLDDAHRYGVGVQARGGNDVICAVGADAIYGGDGNDLIFGTCPTIGCWYSGDDGDDIIHGSLGNPEVLIGGLGNDTLYGDSHAPRHQQNFDQFDHGVDYISGGEGIDLIYGQQNDDYIVGGAGSDIVYGGWGSDTIIGGHADEQNGIHLDVPTGIDVGDRLYGGPGDDEIEGNIGADEIYGGDGDDLLFSHQRGRTDQPPISGVPSFYEINGTSRDVDTAGSRMFGGAGDDTLIGSNRWDRMQGGSGNDWLWGFEGRDYMRGGPGNDLLIGGRGIDDQNGNTGNDRILHHDADKTNGGFGRDTCESLAWPTNRQVVRCETITQIDRSQLTFLSDTPPPMPLTSGPCEDLSPTITVETMNSDIDIVNATGEDDVIIVRISSPLATDLTVNALGGDDIICVDSNLEPHQASARLIVEGGSGDDEIRGHTTSEVLIGGPGHDIIYGGGGPDFIAGMAGDDVLFGNQGQDIILGLAGSDTIHGGYSADIIHGGSGADSINGGTSADDLDGGTQRRTAHDRFPFPDPEHSRWVDDGDDTSDLILGGPGNDDIFGGPGDDTINGGDGDDVVDAGQGNDYIDGAADSDKLHGGFGDDTLLAGSGHDELFGGPDNDVLTGGDGQEFNKLHGGPGDDTLRTAKVSEQLNEYLSNAGDWLFGGDGNDRCEAIVWPTANAHATDCNIRASIAG